MSEEPEANPYAPPQANVELVFDEDDCLWRVEGNDLWVKNGAHFPGVDLARGEIELEDAVLRTVRLESKVSQYITLFIVMLSIGGSELYKAITGDRISFSWVFFLFLILSPLWRKWMPGASIVFEERASAVQRRNRVKRIGMVLGIGLIVAGLLALFLSKHGNFPWGFSCMMGGLAVLVVTSIVYRMLTPQLRAAGNVTGWFRLSGIAPKVIEHLLHQQPEQESMRGIPAPADASVLPESSGG